MLDTKLKNNRKITGILIVVFLLLCSLGMTASYPMYQNRITQEGDQREVDDAIENIWDYLVPGIHFLYNEVYQELDFSYVMENYGDNDFFLLRKYMDCELYDEDGNALTGENDEKVAKKLKAQNSKYAFRATFQIDADGEATDITVDGSAQKVQEQYQIEKALYSEFEYDENWDYISTPSDVTAVFAISEENLDAYMTDYSYDTWTYAGILSYDSTYIMLEWGLTIFVAAVAFVLTLNKSLRIWDWKIFRAPLELVLLVWAYVVGNRLSRAVVAWNAVSGQLETDLLASGIQRDFARMSEQVLNIGMWFLVFASVYWGVTCLSAMLFMKKAYWKERTICSKVYTWYRNSGDDSEDKIRKGMNGITGMVKRCWQKFKGWLHQIYDGLLHMDLQEKTNKSILRIVSINFVVLLIITCFWFVGIGALVIYSVILFLFLRKYFRDIQSKYQLLLESTNLLAEGNLDAPIEGDLGLFNPMKEEIQKIQKGFKKAVEEEVKSERMKTELITNVSHDLKTPLTAIITYVDLLKSEEDPEKRKEYLEILERKSLRLKVLIEDLFEISKATSKNVTMNFMKVDIVGLLKQVRLECDRKIQDAKIDFRWNLPEEKVVLLLDSQKTYRIFENLIVNITKYGMPHTRAYIELIEQENGVTVTMKNVSASELNFNPEEITARFVRGDSSRNTEGSGLGLAIAQSFTELQYGTLKVFTDADLFKVELYFPKRTDVANASQTEN